MHRVSFFLTLVAVAAVAGAADPPDTLHYQGVLRLFDQAPVNGTLPMTFRLFDAETGGNEILVDAHAGVTMVDGLFDASIGGGSVADGAGPGDYTSLAAVFRDHGNVWMLIEVAGETLDPRVEIASAPFALNARRVRGHEMTTGGPVDLYVDAATGDDARDGLSPATAKATIQAAVDLIPPVVYDDVTVHVADGTYAEWVRLYDRSAPTGALITLEGNPADPAQVVVTGSSTRLRALEVTHLSQAVINGFTFREAVNWAVVVLDSGATLSNSIVRDSVRGMLSTRSTVDLDSVQFLDNAANGLYCSAASRCLLSGFTASGSNVALSASRAAQVRFVGPGTITGNATGCQVGEGATLDLLGRFDITVTGNAVSILAETQARAWGYLNAIIDAPACTADAATYGLCL